MVFQYLAELLGVRGVTASAVHANASVANALEDRDVAHAGAAVGQACKQAIDRVSPDLECCSACIGAVVRVFGAQDSDGLRQLLEDVMGQSLLRHVLQRGQTLSSPSDELDGKDAAKEKNATHAEGWTVAYSSFMQLAKDC